MTFCDNRLFFCLNNLFFFLKLATVSFERFRFLLARLGVKKSLAFKSPNRVVFIILNFFLGLVNCKLSVENNDLGKKLLFIYIMNL